MDGHESCYTGSLAVYSHGGEKTLIVGAAFDILNTKVLSDLTKIIGAVRMMTRCNAVKFVRVLLSVHAFPRHQSADFY